MDQKDPACGGVDLLHSKTLLSRILFQGFYGRKALHMDMIVHLLVPGMEDLDDTGDSPEIFYICRKLQKGLCAAFVKKAVQGFLVFPKEGVQFMGQREDICWILRSFMKHPSHLVKRAYGRGQGHAGGRWVWRDPSFEGKAIPWGGSVQEKNTSTAE